MSEPTNIKSEKVSIQIEHKGESQFLEQRKGLGFQALASKHKIPLEFDCRKSDCGICIFKVLEGKDNLTAKTPAEADFLNAMHADPQERLGCQTNIIGPVTISIESHEEITEGITLSPLAIKEAVRLQHENSDFSKKSLRLYLEGKGCDGFYYGVTFDDATTEDIHYPNESIDVIVDPKTLTYTNGSIINWIDDERGKGFLVANPSQTNFRGKFYKQSSWLEKFKEEEKAKQ
jgi:iron-sulfur cluster insertion protein